MAQSAYLTRDYAIAEPAARRAVEVRTSTPAQNKFEELWRAEYRALHAMALAKLGRIAEARTALEPAVRYHAGLPALDEAEWVRVRRALVRLAQALVTPGQAQALLGEAAQLLEGLPPEQRATNSGIQLGNEIAIEQGRRR